MQRKKKKNKEKKKNYEFGYCHDINQSYVLYLILKVTFAGIKSNSFLKIPI